MNSEATSGRVPGPVPGPRVAAGSPPRHERRLLELDALRGIAALLVVLYHYTSRYPDMYGGVPPFEFIWGIYGVDLFFIISGYVIFMTLEQVRRPLDFVVSRFTRLFPAYWACILLTAALVTFLHLPGREPTLLAVAVNFSMLQFLIGVPNVDGVYWTLAVELCFYTTLLVIFCLKLHQRIIAIAAAWLVLIVAGDYLEQQLGVMLPKVLETFILLKYGQLFWIGIVLYLCGRNGLQPRYVAILLLSLGIEYAFYGAREASFVMLAVLVFTLAVQGRLGFLRQPLWLYLGAISYPLYLLHQNIGYAVVSRLQGHGVAMPLSILVALVLVLSLATAVTFLIERPAMAYLRRRYQTWRGRPDPVPVA